MPARYGMWALVPVTDYEIINRRPSQQCDPTNRSIKSLLTSSTADEGVSFTPRNVITNAKFANYLCTLLPLLGDGLQKRVLEV